MAPYEFSEIEPRWQKRWLADSTFRTLGPGDEGFDPSKPKYYVLDMFPYPSGAGLHVGHPKGYTATDIMARYKRHQGFNVLHPMGWDAFGLPAEQYAIQTGTHPRETTEKNVNHFRQQLQSLGLSYDWDREVNTTDPNYYRWTQWIFRKLFEKGLAYQAEAPVWWCEELGTVLANEEVIDGKSERGGHACVKRPLRQWMLKITAYAERLLEDLDGLDWPGSVKAMQKEWIGRSEGAELDFQILDAPESSFRVFTTRPDTLFGATFCVLSPEHPLVDKITTAENLGAVQAYRKEAATKSDLERAELQKEKTGVFTGAFACNPLFEVGDSRRNIPVWVADYVLMSYGTGAIMCVPGGDERDLEFAHKMDLAVVEIEDADGNLIHSDWLNGKSVEKAKEMMCQWLEKQGIGQAKVTYRLRDWLFSRQRYWGEPFPILHGEDGEIVLAPAEDLPVTLPELDDFTPNASGDPPLARAKEWCKVVDDQGKVWQRETNSMPQWAGSCWYYLRFLDPTNASEAWATEKEKYWMPVDLYVGGAEHAVLHLLYARFWHKVLFDCGLVSNKEPFQKLVNQGMVQSFAFKDSRGVLVAADEVEVEGDQFFRSSDREPLERMVAKMSKSLRNVVNPDDVIAEFGADTVRLYEAFMGPVTASAPWNPRDLPGAHRFLQRAWRLFEKGLDEGVGDSTVEKALHACNKKVTADLEEMSNNTALAAMMEFVNTATKSTALLSKTQAETFALLLEPFAPHIAEELWSLCGNQSSCAWQPWPSFDEALLSVDTVELPIQLNGKVRARMEIAADADPAQVEEMALKVVKDMMEGKTLRKAIIIPGRMVNLVVG